MQVGGLSGITYAVGSSCLGAYYSLAISSDIPAPKIGPMVSEVYPADGATGVLRSTDIAALFSEPIDPATVTTSTVTLVKDGTTTPISIKMGLMDSYPEKLWIAPWPEAGPVELDANTKYTVKIGGTNGVKDLEGNQLGGGNQASGDYWWSFTTATHNPQVAPLPVRPTRRPSRAPQEQTSSAPGEATTPSKDSGATTP